MIIDQDEINALLANAADLADEPETQTPAATTLAPPAATAIDTDALPDDIRRMLRIRVPVIVRLADRLMALGEIMKVSPGSIIEFDKLGDSELDLMINNRVIGQGSAVKVGENFGLRIQSIGRVDDRIRSMGG